MAFTAITDAEIEVGEPTAKPLFEKIQGNLDDHESRLGSAETGLTSRTPIQFEVNGLLTSEFIKDGLLIYRVASSLTLTAARLFVHLAGNVGTVTVDVEYKRGAGVWTSLLTGEISSVYTDGDYHVESGTLNVTALQAGDLIRLNLDSVQSGMKGFTVYLENEVS